MTVYKKGSILGILLMSLCLGGCTSPSSSSTLSSSSSSSGDASSSSAESSSSSMTSSSESEDYKYARKYSLDMDYTDNFKILWLTDLHYGLTCPDKAKEKTHLDNLIKKAGSVDLMVLTGDFLWRGESEDIEQYTDEQIQTMQKACCDELIPLLDSYGIKWCYLNGNHDLEPFRNTDDEYYINNKIKACKNQVFVDYDNDGVDGLQNYCVNLKKSDGSILYRLYMVDSNDDGIHSNQIDHLKLINKGYNDDATGMLFYHIPIPQYKEAWTGYKSGRYTGQGSKGEDQCTGGANTIYNQLVRCNILGSFCGHDHKNNYDVFYKDEMYLCYGEKSSDLCYYDSSMVGYKVITLPSDPKNFSLKSIVTTKFGY